MTTEEIEDVKENLVEELHALPVEEQQKVIAQMVRIHQGPIPPPEEMEAYKKIDPAIVDYILSEAKANGEHLRECEKKDVEGRVTYNLRGQRYALAVTGGSLAICGLAIVFLDGMAGNIIALIFGVTGVTPIVTSCIESMRAIFNKDKKDES